MQQKCALSGLFLAFLVGCGGGGGGSGQGTGGAAGSTGSWNGEPGRLWASNPYPNTVSEIDTASGNVLAAHDISAVGTEPTSIAVGDGSVWFTLNGHDQLSRLTPERTVEATEVGGAYAVAYGDGSAWATAGALFVSRVDGETGTTLADVLMDSMVIHPVAFGAGSAWVLAGSSIDRIDSATNQPSASIAVPEALRGYLILSSLAFGEGALWMLGLDNEQRVLLKIDPSTNVIVAQKALATDGANDDVAAGLGSVWVSSEYGSKIFMLDPATLEVQQEIALPGAEPAALALGTSFVYASDFGGGRLHKIDPSSGDSESVEIVSASGLAFESN